MSQLAINAIEQHRVSMVAFSKVDCDVAVRVLLLVFIKPVDVHLSVQISQPSLIKEKDDE